VTRERAEASRADPVSDRKGVGPGAPLGDAAPAFPTAPVHDANRVVPVPVKRRLERAHAVRFTFEMWRRIQREVTTVLETNLLIGSLLSARARSGRSPCSAALCEDPVSNRNRSRYSLLQTANVGVDVQWQWVEAFAEARRVGGEHGGARVATATRNKIQSCGCKMKTA
jgi:hypothetical protein